jgi:hypothetical protein
LLPGLCLYAERWLREEVFTHFRDLAEQQTALKDYFADPQVQSFLETMPMTQVSQPAATYRRPVMNTVSPPAPPVEPQPVVPPLQTPVPSNYEESASAFGPLGEHLIHANAAPTAAKEGNLSVAERVSQLSPEGKLQPSKRGGTPPPTQNGHRPSPAVVEPEVPSNRRSPRSSPKWGRLAGVVVVALLAFGSLGFITLRTLSWIGAMLSAPKLQQPALDIGLVEPAVSIPTPPPPEAQITTRDIAERTIADWLEAKRAALGSDHNVENLNNVLIDPALTQWRNRANGGVRDNWYFDYQHSLDILNVEPDDPAAEALTVEAEVKEVADFYQLGTRVASESYDATVNMRYELVQQDGSWFVRDMNEVE